MRKRGAATRLATRERQFWVSLTKIGQPHRRPDPPPDDLAKPALHLAFKAFRLDIEKSRDWKLLCAELASILFPPEKPRGRKKRRRPDSELLTALMYGQLPDDEKQHAYEALSRLRKAEPKLASKVKKLAKLALT